MSKLTATAQNLQNRYKIGDEAYEPNFTIVGDDRTTMPALKMFGSLLAEMRRYNMDLIEAINGLKDAQAINAEYVKVVADNAKEEKKERKNANAVKKKKDKKEKGDGKGKKKSIKDSYGFSDKGGNYNKLYYKAAGAGLTKLYKTFTPEIIQSIFSAGKGVYDFNKKLRAANKADKQAREKRKQTATPKTKLLPSPKAKKSLPAPAKKSKKFDSASGKWVASDAPQGEDRKEKGKLSKAIKGLTSFLKKGKKDGKGGGFLSALFSGLGLMRFLGGFGKFGRLLFMIIPGLSMLTKLFSPLLGGFKALASGLSSACSAVASFGSKVLDWGKGAASKIKDGAVAVKDLASKGVDKVKNFGKGAIDGAKNLGGKIFDWGKGAASKIKDGLGVAKNAITPSTANAATKAAGVAGKRLLAAATPAGAVASAGWMGYEFGTWLNERFNLSDGLLDCIVKIQDKVGNAIQGKASLETREQIKKNPASFPHEKRVNAAISDLRDAKDAGETDQKKLDALFETLKKEYSILEYAPENGYVKPGTATDITKSQVKTDLNAHNGDVIKEAATQKSIDSSVAANKTSSAPPAVINNQPITNVYNNGGNGGAVPLSTHNQDNSFTRNLDYTQNAWAYP